VRGALLKQVGEKLEVRDDLTAIGPEPGQVRVKIRATGVCHSDLSFQNGTIPIPTPSVLGHEGSGEILAVGEGVTGVEPGDHVVISWVPPCGVCRFCLGGQANLCTSGQAQAAMNPALRLGDQVVFGNSGAPTFIEETVIPASGAIPIAPDVPLDIASLIGCGVTTGVGAALNTARVEPGSSVVVFGCGGVGLCVIQGARIAGASEIVAVDLLESKLDVARRFGATHAVKPAELGDATATITGGAGFDYAFEAVGLGQTMRAAYDATRRGGTSVIVGVGKMDDTVQFNGFELCYQEKKLVGSFYGSADVRREFGRLLGLWKAGRLELEGLISDRTDLSQINEALQALRDGDVIRTVIEFP
jgi:S-(hydroxymethyl)glutathione dehydrogenase/alcohol dehydrogenase